MKEINRNRLPKTVQHEGKTFHRNLTYDGLMNKDQLTGQEDKHVIVNVKSKTGTIKKWIFSLK
jgi:hypothetical protein